MQRSNLFCLGKLFKPHVLDVDAEFIEATLSNFAYTFSTGEFYA